MQLVCCFSVGLTDVHDVTLMFFWLDCCFVLFFFSLWPAGGVLHFHSDSMCSEDLDKVSMKHDHCLLHLPWSGFEHVLYLILYSSSHFVCPRFFYFLDTLSPHLALLLYLCVQMEDSPSPKRQRLSQQTMLDLNSAPPSTPSSPIRPWELPPSRRPHPHYMAERCHTPLRNRRR